MLLDLSKGCLREWLFQERTWAWICRRVSFSLLLSGHLPVGTLNHVQVIPKQNMGVGVRPGFESWLCHKVTVTADIYGVISKVQAFCANFDYLPFIGTVTWGE